MAFRAVSSSLFEQTNFCFLIQSRNFLQDGVYPSPCVAQLGLENLD